MLAAAGCNDYDCDDLCVDHVTDVDHRDPQIATASGRTLIAWTSAGGVDGRWLDEADAQTLVERVDGRPFAMATDGRDALIGWEDSAGRLDVQLASAAAPTALASLHEHLGVAQLAMAFDGSGYVVAWVDDSRLNVARVGSDGAVLESQPLATEAVTVAMSVDAAGAVLAWTDPTARAIVGRTAGLPVHAVEGGQGAAVSCAAAGCVLATAVSSSDVTVERLDAQLQPIGAATIHAGTRLGHLAVAGSPAHHAIAWFVEDDSGVTSTLLAQVFDGTYGPTQVLAPSPPLPGEQLILPGDLASAEHDGTLDVVWATDSERATTDAVHSRYELVRTSLQHEGHTPPATFE